MFVNEVATREGPKEGLQFLAIVAILEWVLSP